MEGTHSCWRASLLLFRSSAAAAHSSKSQAQLAPLPQAAPVMWCVQPDHASSC